MKNEAKQKRKAQIEKAEAGDFGAIISESLPKLVHPDHAADKLKQQTITTAYYDSGVKCFIKQQEAIMGRADSLPTLEKIKVPTLVITSDEDQLISKDFSKEIADGITGGKLVVIPRAGHMSPLEQPDAVAKALEEWLEE